MNQLSTADGKITGVQSGDGPDLVILHSLLTDRTAFDAVLPALLKQHRVTLFNLPGFHGSAPIAASLSAYVAWIAQGFDAFAIEPGGTLLGNGFGGTLALAFALDHPDRLQRLVICDAAAGCPEPGKQAFRMMAQKIGEGGMGAIAEVAANRVFHAEYLTKNPGATEE